MHSLAVHIQNFITSLLITGSRYPSLRRAGLSFYRLKFASCVKKLQLLGPGVHLVLRRKMVFTDGLPGESDLDLSIVVADDRLSDDTFIAKLAAYIRSIQNFPPLIGEVWIIPASHWQLHTSYHQTDYLSSDGSLKFAEHKERLPLEATIRKAEFLLFSIATLRDAFTSKPLLYRSRLKHRQIKYLVKWEWLSNLEAGVEKRLSYLGAPYKGNDFGSLDDLADRFPTPHPRPITRQLVLNIVGEFQGLNAKKTQTLQDQWADIPDEYRRYCKDLLIVPYRPFQFRYALILVLKRKPPQNIHENLIASLHTYSARLSRTIDLSPSVIPVFLSDTWDSIFAADPVFDLLQRTWSYSLLSRQVCATPLRTLTMNQYSLKRELVHSIDMFFSSLRSTSTNYIFDLFAYTFLLKEALESGHIFLNVNHYRAEFASAGLPHSMIDSYMDGDQNALDHLDLPPVWQKMRAKMQQVAIQFRE